MIFLFAFCQLILTFSFPVTCCENTFGCQHKVSTNDYNSIPDFVTRGKLILEGKINIKAGDLLWQKKNIFINFLLEDRNKMFSPSLNIIFSPNTDICSQQFTTMFFRKFNIKGLSCLSFQLASFREVFAKIFANVSNFITYN